MDNEEIPQDNALLARLNALKKSSVKLGTINTLADPKTKGSALKERFGALKIGLSPSSATKPESLTGASALQEKNADDPPSPTLEELLADLNDEGKDHAVGRNEITEAQTLLAEAQRALKPENDKSAEARSSHDSELEKSSSDIESVPQNVSNEDGEEANEVDEDAEAVASLQRILDEVATIAKTSEGSAGPDERESSEEPSKGDDHVDEQRGDIEQGIPLLPSAPSHLPPPRLSADEASFPSAPTTLPRPASSKKAPKFTDAEIDTWCIICLADATIRCLDCAGDLYCSMCWKEGHTGPDAGYEERRHKSEKLRRSAVGST